MIEEIETGMTGKRENPVTGMPRMTGETAIGKTEGTVVTGMTEETAAGIAERGITGRGMLAEIVTETGATGIMTEIEEPEGVIGIREIAGMKSEGMTLADPQKF